MSRETKKRLRSALLEIVAHIDQPIPEWGRTRELATDFVDELQGHLEDEFVTGAEPADDQAPDEVGELWECPVCHTVVGDECTSERVFLCPNDDCPQTTVSKAGTFRYNPTDPPDEGELTLRTDGGDHSTQFGRFGYGDESTTPGSRLDVSDQRIESPVIQAWDTDTGKELFRIDRETGEFEFGRDVSESEAAKRFAEHVNEILDSNDQPGEDGMGEEWSDRGVLLFAAADARATANRMEDEGAPDSEVQEYREAAERLEEIRDRLTDRPAPDGRKIPSADTINRWLREWGAGPAEGYYGSLGNYLHDMIVRHRSLRDPDEEDESDA